MSRVEFDVGDALHQLWQSVQEQIPHDLPVSGGRVRRSARIMMSGISCCMMLEMLCISSSDRVYLRTHLYLGGG
jgi:hypothetical protein